MRVFVGLSFAVIVGCAVEEAPREYNYPLPVQQITTTQVSVGQTITATSRDGTFGIHFVPGCFDEPVSVRINQGNASPAPAVTLSKSYAVTVTPTTAELLQPVELSFVMTQAAVDAAGGASNLRVGHGETPGQPWFESLPGTYDAGLSRLSVTTSSFSYFLVFDLAGFNACACDTGPGCQTGCGFCDVDCDQPTCIDDGDCDSNCCVDGACVPASYCDEPDTCIYDEDCESSCCVNGACVPVSYCEEPTSCFDDEDCESLCCVTGVCMPASYCEVPVECYEHADCESDCCLEGICEPSTYCSPETCSYDYECESECCYDGVCSPADYCAGGCTYDYECETECCYEGVCSPVSYCVQSCSYDYECETECCYEGVCSPASYCVQSCSYDYECESECCYENVCAPADYCVETCTYDYNCESGCCVDGICVDASYCETDCTTGALGCSGDYLVECVDGQWSYDGASARDCGAEGLDCEPVTDTWAECVALGCDPETEWQCNDGGCIPAEYRCDRYAEGPDCVDGSDEDPYCPVCSSDLDCPAGEYWHCDVGTGTCFQGL